MRQCPDRPFRAAGTPNSPIRSEVGASGRGGQPRHIKVVLAGGVAAGDLGLFFLRCLSGCACLDGNAIEFARQQPIDRIHGHIPCRDDRLRIMFIRIDEAARRRRGNPACAGQPQDDRARNEVFFSGAITPALGHHASAVRDAGGVGECDVKSLLAFARAIAHQCRRRAEAHQIGAHPNASARHQPGCACQYGSCHRDCGVGAARLCRRKAEKRRKRQRVVGNLRLYQQPRAAGNSKQLADRPTAAPVTSRCRYGPPLEPRPEKRPINEMLLLWSLTESRTKAPNW